MQKIKHWWGWEIKDDDNNWIGSLSRKSHGWDAVNSDNEIIGKFRLKKEAMNALLNQENGESLFDGWVSANDILSEMTESEFRCKWFTGEITILEMHLGQPRHGKIMGNGMFRLAQ